MRPLRELLWFPTSVCISFLSTGLWPRSASSAQVFGDGEMLLGGDADGEALRGTRLWGGEKISRFFCICRNGNCLPAEISPTDMLV